MSEQKLDYPYLAILPYEVMKVKKIPAAAKIHYACLVGLSKKEGYCWATDEQLAEMHEVDISQIKRWNLILEKKGFISRETKNVTYRSDDHKMLWKKNRKIYVNDGFSRKEADSDKKDTNNEQRKNAPIDEQRKNAPIDEQRKNAPYKEESYKEQISKEGKGCSPPSKRKKISEPMAKREEEVYTTDKQHSALLKKLGCEKKLNRAYEILSNWKLKKEIQGGSDYLCLTGWVIQALKEEVENGNKSKSIGTREFAKSGNIYKAHKNDSLSRPSYARAKQLPGGKRVEVPFGSNGEDSGV